MSFLQNRLDSLIKQIDAFEAAMVALGDNNVQAYTLDTGQTVQKVTKLDLEWMTGTLNSLYNQYTVIEARMKRSGTSIGVASW